MRFLKPKGLDGRSFAYGGVFLGSLALAATCSTLATAPQSPEPAAAVATPAAAEAPANVRIREYLSPDLRRRVEQLKKDVAASATTLETADARALVLYDWLNAYALTGRQIPVNMPQIVAAVTQPGPSTRAVHQNLDEYVRELTLYEEEPDARGSLVSRDTGPFQPGSMQTITMTFTVGSRPIEPGGGFMIGRHFMSNQGVYQTGNPSGADYVTARASRAGARLEVSARPLSGMFGGFTGAADALFFRVSGARLEPGDVVTLTVGDRSQGGPGFRVQTFGNDGLRIPVFLAFSDGAPLISLPDIAYSIEGGPVAKVKGFAPSIAGVGEPVTVSVRGEDVYRNRATGPQPGYIVYDNGREHSRIPAGREAIRLLRDIRFTEPGVHRLTFRSEDGRITGEANPILVREQKGQGVYWGETHAHSAFAEGQGTINFFYTFGRDDARLDFLGMSEHDLWMDDWEWEELRKAAVRYDKPGEFMTFLAYEWTTPTTYGGHHNVFFRTPEGRSRSSRQRCPTLTQLYACLKAANDTDDVLIIPHAHQTGEYRIGDPEMQTLVEIMSLHGTFDWFGQRYLAQGQEVGFIAASDDHLSHPGYAAPLPSGLGQRSGLAAVVAPEKSRDAIFDAMKARRTYATTGERIILEYDVAGGTFGERIAMTADRKVALRAIGTAPIAGVTIVKNGELVHEEDYITDRTGRSTRVAVGFASETDPKIRENARGWRVWSGVLTVRGAKIQSVSAPGVTNILSESVTAGADGSTVEFTIRTRGDEDVLYMDLDRLPRNGSIEIDLKPARESGTPLILSQFHAYPEMQVSLPFSRLKDGMFTVRTPGAVSDDRVTLRTLNADPPMERSVTWTDTGPAAMDDNYYVRVTQTDGAQAWTSPVWVGGFSRRTQ